MIFHPSSTSEALWAALDTRMAFAAHDDDPRTLAELVASGVWD